MIISTYLQVDSESMSIWDMIPGDIYLLDKYPVTDDNNYMIFIKVSKVLSRLVGSSDIISIPNDKYHITHNISGYRCSLVMK